MPPIKIQGIKTKLIPFIQSTVDFSADGDFSAEGRWIEPFLGSGVVAFNIAPSRAILADKNQHLINFYQGIQNKTITPVTVREFLEFHGAKLAKSGQDYYLHMREVFNENHDPMHFLFLNRSDFNGVIRFNKSGKFNVPFCHKPERFAKAYVTKICNQVGAVAAVMEGKDWTFLHQDWQATMAMANSQDHIYLDPPYIGRDTSYVGEWPEEEAIALADAAHQTSARVCLSHWKENKFRRNEHLFDHWADFHWHEQSHFYHLGAKENNRHAIVEVLATNY
ncbi:MAG: Dam family site-specific DNA-(adenine-N6)-methyltransferase [Corynebacterium sp.]|nr:Dam family site-specific DNA-(adenine-N6)-methyltransferase [Corynebacterium sp.]